MRRAQENETDSAATETHQLTQVCWTKCFTGNVSGSKLDKTEEGCLANCVNRFMDLNLLTVKHLNSMRH
ncbi:Tim10/DDP family zinc finger protein [Emericellopsis atlantica]|uniref:Mitochondrial import inner membrane translocase subunit n=1 Tax=Emericellopsis atlantica TaxID=2614577 RepID=A0A9P7ZII9_9HYPO|nr:Tim10/DDP family zinc finger protein [Emericellopsis atlantica]KAG9252773.1 Tim10/DDP family zinc finger protein [Emericellopsis atlantica]